MPHPLFSPELRVMLADDDAAGLTEGLAEGRKQQTREIARTMLTNGLEIALITQVTGLTPGEIEQLKQT